MVIIATKKKEPEKATEIEGWGLLLSVVRGASWRRRAEPGGSGGESQEDIRGRSIPGIRNSKCNGRETEVCSPCVRKRRLVRPAGNEWGDSSGR